MKTLLLLAESFYPTREVAAIRATQLALFLPGHDWHVIVLTRRGEPLSSLQMAARFGSHVKVVYLDGSSPADPAALGSESDSTNKAVPIRTTAKGSIKGQIGKALAHVVPPGFTPHPQWLRARGVVRRLVREHGVEVILTTCPSTYPLEVGRWAARRLGVPWVADYRDPILIDPRFCPPGSLPYVKLGHALFERSVYREAAHVVHAIPVHHRWARRAYPWARQRMSLITNGYPPEMLDGRVPAMTPPPGRQSVRVIGFFSPTTIEPLARAVAHLAAQRRDVDLTLVGKGDPGRAATTLGEDRLVRVGQVPHEQALAYAAGADVLVSALDPERAKATLLSSKLFEYLATGVPVLAINPTLSDRWLLRQFPAAAVLEKPTHAAMAAHLERLLDKPRRPRDDAVLRQYSRQVVAEALHKVLIRVTSGRTGRGS